MRFFLPLITSLVLEPVPLNAAIPGTVPDSPLTPSTGSAAPPQGS